MYPAILEFAALVERQRGDRVVGAIGQEHAALDQDLKAVADPQDQLAGVLESEQRVSQVMPHLIAEDAAGADVVAIAEAAWDAQNLILRSEPRIFEQGIQVHRVGSCTGRLEGERRFAVAVGAGGTEDEDVGLHGDFTTLVVFAMPPSFRQLKDRSATP